jgi:DEAD/DEAH box helicase domain-containing protein
MALTSAAGTDLDSPLVALNRHAGASAPPGLPRSAQGAFSYHAVFQLLSALAMPPGTLGSPDAAITQLQRNALWLGYLMVPSTQKEMESVKGDLATWTQKLPTWLESPGAKHLPSLSRDDASPVAVSWWPMVCIDGKLEGVTSPGALVLDDIVDQSEQKPHLDWRRWLQLFNTFQTLPGMVMTTLSGIQAGDLESLMTLRPAAVAPVGSTDQVALSQEWTAALEMTVEELRSGLHTLARLGAMPPVMGCELANERGMVVAEAEMAWADSHLVLLTFDQVDLESVWKSNGWTTLVLDENCSVVDGAPWTDAVCIALGIGKSEKSNEGEST